MARILFLLFLSFTATVDAAYYLHFFGGANWMTDRHSTCFVDAETGFYAGASMGYDFRKSCRWYRYNRFEVEYTIRKNQLNSYNDGAVVTSLNEGAVNNSWMVNLYQDIPFCVGEASPYCGGGIGYSYFSRLKEFDDVCGIIRNNNGFAWQVIAGFSLPVNVATLLEVDYRFFVTTGDLYNHSLGLALRYRY